MPVLSVMSVMSVMSWIFSPLFWFLLALVQFFAGFLWRAVMAMCRLFWPAVLVATLTVLPQVSEAGWFSWLWGDANIRHLERSLDVAQEAARVASEAAEAQAQQAVAQAEQNARLAETLGQLSSERTNLADRFYALTELGLKDSQWAAAVGASGPILVCVTALLVAGLALWLANRPVEAERAALGAAFDSLVEEVAAQKLVTPEISKSQSRPLALEAWGPRGLTRNLEYATPGQTHDQPYDDDANDDEPSSSEPNSEPMPF